MQITEGMQAYGVSAHRHMPEIEQGLADAAGAAVRVSFTPHLIPMSRGMQSTMYVQLAEGASADSLRSALADFYKDEYFVRCVLRYAVCCGPIVWRPPLHCVCAAPVRNHIDEGARHQHGKRQSRALQRSRCVRQRFFLLPCPVCAR